MADSNMNTPTNSPVRIIGQMDSSDWVFDMMDSDLSVYNDVDMTSLLAMLNEDSPLTTTTVSTYFSVNGLY